MAKDALSLLAVAFVSAIIGCGVAYYYLWYKKPLLSVATIRIMSGPSTIRAAAFSPGIEIKQREIELVRQIRRLKTSIRIRKSAIGKASTDQIAEMNKLIAEDETTLKQAENELNGYMKTPPK